MINIMDTIMARLAQQEEAQKAMNDVHRASYCHRNISRRCLQTKEPHSLYPLL